MKSGHSAIVPRFPTVQLAGLTQVAQLLWPVLLACLLHAEAGQAATQDPDTVRQEMERREQERIDQRRQALELAPSELKTPAPSADLAELPAESPCFVIKTIKLSGKRADRFAGITAKLDKAIGRCVGVKGLAMIASALDQALVERGYVTSRVSLPAQNLRDGELEIVLQPGLIGAIRIEDAPQASAWGTWRNAMPSASGELLNIRDIEQGLEQMKRLTRQQVATRIEPGALPDTSTVVIERRQADLLGRLHGGVSLDNGGSKALGRGNAALNAAMDNPAGWNDLVNLSLSSNLSQPTKEHRSQSAALFYSIPYGYHLFSVFASSSRFGQYVQGTTTRFLSSGSSQSVEGKWGYTAWRTASTKTGASLSLSSRRSRSFLDDVELVVQRRRVTNIEAALTHKQLYAKATLDIELAHRRGVGWNGAQEDLPFATAGGATVRPRITTLSAEFSLPFRWLATDLRYDSRLRLQTTPDMTLSIDQFAIGSRGSVRGFDGDTVLQAERGFYWRNELAAGSAWGQALGVQWLPYAALDLGAVSGPSAEFLTGRRLAGAALGLRAAYKTFNADLALAFPILQPANFPRTGSNIYLSVSRSF